MEQCINSFSSSFKPLSMELTWFEGYEWAFSTVFNGYVISGYKIAQINHLDVIRELPFLSMQA